MSNEKGLLASQTSKFDSIIRTFPGLGLALGLALLANWLAPRLGQVVLRLQGLDPGTAASPVSAILVAVLLGLIIRNTVGLAPAFQPGIGFAMKAVLRWGIVLLGLRLSFFDALRIGAWGIPVVAITVLTGIVVTNWIGRWLKQSDRLGILIAASTAICGITAVMATAPVVNARDREITYAVATVTIFGMMAMMVYPYLAFALFSGDAVRAGLFLGTAIHDTAQVTGAALIYSQLFGQPQALDVATVTKLLRNVFLVVVVPALALIYAAQGPAGEYWGEASEAGGEAGCAKSRPPLSKLFPAFVLGFLAMALVRSIGDAGVGADGTGLALGLFSQEAWRGLLGIASQTASVYLLGTAMAAVGLNSSATVLRELGGRPLVVGLLSAVTVGAVAAVLAIVFGGRISL